MVVAAAGLALSACGGDSGSTGSASPTPSGVPSVAVDEALAAQVPEDLKSSGVLVFGTDASYAPSEFFAEDGSTIVGFDVDLGKAIAAKLGLEGQFENATFDSLIVGVQNGKFPASMSSFTITPERLEQVNMISYFSAGTGWAVQTGNPAGVSIDATFQNGRVTGAGVCNRYFANYSATPVSNLAISDVGATKVMCPQNADFESAYFDSLSKTTRFVIAGNSLKLLTPSGSLDFAK